MKIIAMDLRQFHITPENDAWWGEGFTDWVSVRNERPLLQLSVNPGIEV